MFIIQMTVAISDNTFYALATITNLNNTIINTGQLVDLGCG